MKNNENKKDNKILWSLLFVLIAVLTIWAVTSQSASFSAGDFVAFLQGLDPMYTVLAFVSMLFFVLFEGLAIMTIIRSFGYPRNVMKGFSYSAADIYFSAITPSATGGQPASALFMMHDGIPGPIVTVALLTNLIMYTFAIIIIGIVSFFINPAMFFNFSVVSRVLIVVGCVLQVSIAVIFILLLKKDKVLYKISAAVLSVLAKLRLLKNIESKKEKLRTSINEYHMHVSELRGKAPMLMRALLFNVIQRASLIAVTVFAFLASGGSFELVSEIWVSQSMVVLGSNTVPIPGAMGVADYLLIDVLGGYMDASAAINLELFSRAVSFYFCVLLCGLVFLGRIVIMQIIRPTGEEARAGLGFRCVRRPEGGVRGEGAEARHSLVVPFLLMIE